MGWAIAAGGLFAICGAVLDWEWFMNHHKARFFVKIFGRMGTRIFYGLLGTGLVVLGVLLGMGVIQDSQ